MNQHRERIVAAFESLKRLLCDLGYFVEGDSTKGVWVRYWGNQRLRELKTYRHGVQDGFAVVAYGPVNPPHYRHYRTGEPFGESLRYFSNGQLMEHVLVDGETKIPYSEEAAVKFKGYLTTEREDELFRRYAIHPVRELFM